MLIFYRRRRSRFGCSLRCSVVRRPTPRVAQTSETDNLVFYTYEGIHFCIVEFRPAARQPLLMSCTIKTSVCLRCMMTCDLMGFYLRIENEPSLR